MAVYLTFSVLGCLLLVLENLQMPLKVGNQQSNYYFLLEGFGLVVLNCVVWCLSLAGETPKHRSHSDE